MTKNNILLRIVLMSSVLTQSTYSWGYVQSFPQVALDSFFKDKLGYQNTFCANPATYNGIRGFCADEMTEERYRRNYAEDGTSKMLEGLQKQAAELVVLKKGLETIFSESKNLAKEELAKKVMSLAEAFDSSSWQNDPLWKELWIKNGRQFEKLATNCTFIMDFLKKAFKQLSQERDGFFGKLIDVGRYSYASKFSIMPEEETQVQTQVYATSWNWTDAMIAFGIGSLLGVVTGKATDQLSGGRSSAWVTGTVYGVYSWFKKDKKQELQKKTTPFGTFLKTGAKIVSQERRIENLKDLEDLSEREIGMLKEHLHSAREDLQMLLKHQLSKKDLLESYSNSVSEKENQIVQLMNTIEEQGSRIEELTNFLKQKTPQFIEQVQQDLLQSSQRLEGMYEGKIHDLQSYNQVSQQQITGLNRMVEIYEQELQSKETLIGQLTNKMQGLMKQETHIEMQTEEVVQNAVQPTRVDAGTTMGEIMWEAVKQETQKITQKGGRLFKKAMNGIEHQANTDSVVQKQFGNGKTYDLSKGTGRGAPIIGHLKQ